MIKPLPETLGKLWRMPLGNIWSSLKAHCIGIWMFRSKGGRRAGWWNPPLPGNACWFQHFSTFSIQVIRLHFQFQLNQLAFSIPTLSTCNQEFLNFSQNNPSFIPRTVFKIWKSQEKIALIILDNIFQYIRKFELQKNKTWIEEEQNSSWTGLDLKSDNATCPLLAPMKSWNVEDWE